ASEKGTDAKFMELIDLLRKDTTFKDLDAIDKAVKVNNQLAEDLRTLLRILMTDDRDEQLRKEREEYTRLLEKLKEVIAKQERVRAATEIGKRESKDLAKDQNKVTGDTKNLIGQGKGDPKGSEAKKGEGKGNGKEGQNAKGEGKNDTQGAKGDAKTDKGENKTGDPKAGDPKADAKPGEGKQGEGKPSDGKQGEGKKDGQNSDGKQGQ